MQTTDEIYSDFVERHKRYQGDAYTKLITELIEHYKIFGGPELLHQEILLDNWIIQQLDFNCTNMLDLAQKLVNLRLSLAEARLKENQ